MSLFHKHSAPPQQRSMADWWGGSESLLVPPRIPHTTAGQLVTPETAKTKVPLLAATNLVADMPSMLGYNVYTGHGGERREVRVPANVRDPEGEGYGLEDFAYKYLACRILRGNVFLRVDDVDSYGRPQVVTLLNPAVVTVRRDTRTGRVEFITPSGAKQPFRRQPMGGIIHRRSYAQPGDVLGLSVIANHARTLGLALAAEQFGADFFGDGAHPSSVLSTEQPVTEEQAKTIKQRFVNAIRGSREPAVLGAGMQYIPIQIAPNESQFLEAQKFTAAEQCRMVGPGTAEMLGYETGGSMTYQNVQSRALHLLVFTVDKWLNDLERLLSDVFVPGQQNVEFDRHGLMRMTPDMRWKMHRDELTLAAKTINEIRADEGLPPVEWGHEPFLPSFGESGFAAAEALDGDSPNDQPKPKQGGSSGGER